MRKKTVYRDKLTWSYTTERQHVVPSGARSARGTDARRAPRTLNRAGARKKK
jgi:hypothetical protein